MCKLVCAREVKRRFINKANCFFFCPYLSCRNRDKVQQVRVREAYRLFSGQRREDTNSRDVSLFLAMTDRRGSVRQSMDVSIFVL